MTQIKCIITDDEPFARKGLQGYIEKISFLQLVAVCEDAIQLNTVLQQQKIDLLFLDIEMPYLSGIELLKSLNNPPKVVFTTAYETYALQGFELDVLDYLLKPISFERFLKAANKAADFFLAKSTSIAEYLFIKTEGRLEKVFYNEIVFVEAMENYVGIYTRDKKLVTHGTLKSMQEKFPSNFIQTHKSYLINPDHITSIEGNLLHSGKFKIPLSKSMKDEVMDKIINKQL